MNSTIIINQYDNIGSDRRFSPQSNFLPNFLMGNSNSIELAPICSPRLPTNPSDSFLNIGTKSVVRHTFSHDDTRRNGPPTLSLWNKSPKSSFARNRPLNDELNGTFSIRSPSIFLEPNNASSQFSLNQNNSLRNSDTFTKFVQLKSGDDKEDCFENWITVYGFQQFQAQQILGIFSKIGPINDKIISNRGNWMHLQYSSSIHVATALHNHGRVLIERTMIGVKLCDDKIAEPPYFDVPPPSRTDSVTNCAPIVASDGGANSGPKVPVTVDRGSGKLSTNLSTSNMRCLTARSDNLIANNNNDNWGPSGNFDPSAYNTAPRRDLLSRAMSMIFGRK